MPLEGRPSVELAELMAVAELTTRVDQKYLVPTDLLPDLMARLPAPLAVLAIDGRRVFDYESVYFDTEAFALYHQHIQGRRKRFKARTRTYRDTGEMMFEVKLKGLRGVTVKERLCYDAPAADELTDEGLDFLHFGGRRGVRRARAAARAAAQHGLPPLDPGRPGAALAGDRGPGADLVRRADLLHGNGSGAGGVQERDRLGGASTGCWPGWASARSG